MYDSFRKADREILYITLTKLLTRVTHTHTGHTNYMTALRDPHLADIQLNKIVETCKQMPITSLKHNENLIPSILIYTYAMNKAAGMANKTADNKSENIKFFKNYAAQSLTPLQVHITHASQDPIKSMHELENNIE